MDENLPDENLRNKRRKAAKVALSALMLVAVAGAGVEAHHRGTATRTATGCEFTGDATLGGYLLVDCDTGGPSNGLLVVDDAGQDVMPDASKHMLSLSHQLAHLGPVDIQMRNQSLPQRFLNGELPSGWRLEHVTKGGQPVHLDPNHHTVMKDCWVASSSLHDMRVATRNCGVLGVDSGPSSPFGAIVPGRTYDMSLDDATGLVTSVTQTKDN